MVNQIEAIKKTLDNSIKELCKASQMFTKDPYRNFTRSRKLPPEKVVRLLLCMEGGSLNNEILRYFNCSPDFATPSAFIQKRQKFNEFALPSLFGSFVKKLMSLKNTRDIAYSLQMDQIFRFPLIRTNQIHILPEPMSKSHTACCIWMLSTICFGTLMLMHACLLAKIGMRAECCAIWSTVPE